MKVEIYYLEDLTDSQEMLEAQTHPMLQMLLYLLLALLLGGFVWSWFGSIDQVVQVNGVLRPSTSSSTVRSAQTGVIKEIDYKDGKFVKKGDTLFTLDDKDLQIKAKELSAQEESARKNLNDLQNLKDNIQQGKLDLAKDSSTTYLSKQSAANNYESEYIGIQEDIQANRIQYQDLNVLETSILQNKNEFSDTKSDSYNQYMVYQSKRAQMDTEQEDQKKQDLAALQNEQLASVRSQLTTLQNDYNQLVAKKNQVLIEITDTIQKQTDTIRDLDGQKKELEASENTLTTKAAIDGVVSVLSEINVGESISSGQDLLKITPSKGSQYLVQIALPDKDVSSVKVGETVNFKFDALPYTEYGEITGQIKSIGADALSDPQSGRFTYLVEAEIPNKPFLNKKGEKAELKPGMAANGSIVTGRERIFDYLMEKLGFKI